LGKSLPTLDWPSAATAGSRCISHSTAALTAAGSCCISHSAAALAAGCDGARLEGNGGCSPIGKEDRRGEALGGSDNSTKNGAAGSGSASVSTTKVALGST
jgi:hypothetical protein